jgi:prevent-host-death family protein
VTADAAGAQYNIHDAKTNLSRIIDRVEHGEEIIISRAGTPVAKVIALNPRAKRTRRGSLAGRLVVTDDWDAPAVNDAIAREFGLPAQ